MATSGTPAGAQPAAPVAAPPTERRLSLPGLLFREGSLTGLGLGLGSMSLGSQDLTGLLDSSLQHMQTLPRMDLELLASPKWKALLCWDDDGSSPMHLDTAGSSDTKVPPHCRFDSDAGPASPGVDQQAEEAGMAAGWKLPPPQPLARGLFGGKGEVLQGTAAGMLVPQEAKEELQRPSCHHQQPRSGAGKKRHWMAEDEDDGFPAAKAPKREQQQVAAEGSSRPGGGAKLRPRLATLSSGDSLMLESEAAAAEAVVAATAAELDEAAAGAGAELDGSSRGGPLPGLARGRQRQDSAPADVLNRMSHVRLNSIGDALQQRRLTAAAAAAAVTPAGRLGRVRRGDSNVPLLMAELPGSPTAGAVQLLSPGEDPFTGPDVTVEVKHEPCLPVMTHKPGIQAVAVPSPAAQPPTQALYKAAAAPPPQPQVQRQVLASKSHKAVATGENGVFTSPYRGVTKHRLTGRFEAHFWDSSYVRPNPKKGGRSRGRQVYLGGYETELEAARAYDRAVLAYCGTQAPLNFPSDDYSDDLAWISGRTPEEVVGILRRGSVGFARGQSQYRGVTRHHQQGKWEARIGKVEGSKYLYLGTYDTADEAARSYDRACVKFRGSKAILNFDLSNYQDILDDPDSYDPLAGSSSSQGPHAGTGSPGPSVDGGSASLRGGAFPSPGKAAHRLAGSAPAVHSAGLAVPITAAGQFLVSPEAAAAAATAAAAAMAGVAAPGGAGSVFLPLMQPMHLPMGVQQQFGVSLCLQPPVVQQYAPVLHQAAGSDPAAAAAPAPRLPAIRTRATAAAVAVAAAARQKPEGAGSGGSSSSSTPASAVPGSSGSSLDLQEFLLSPLAASLLSPLGLSGSPSGWRDSPLGKLAAGELGRLLSGVPPSALLSPPRHRLHQSSGPADGGASGSGPVSRLHSSPSSEMDLLHALQWLDSLDPAQLAALAALEAGAPPAGSSRDKVQASQPGEGFGTAGTASGSGQQPGSGKA